MCLEGLTNSWDLPTSGALLAKLTYPNNYNPYIATWGIFVYTFFNSQSLRRIREQSA